MKFLTLVVSFDSNIVIGNFVVSQAGKRVDESQSPGSVFSSLSLYKAQTLRIKTYNDRR
jgi:hypothetical protein